MGCLAGGCSPSQRALGEDCLKDQDCLSGICLQLQCAAEAPLLDGAVSAPSADGAPSGMGLLDAAARLDGREEETAMTEVGVAAEAEAGGAATDASIAAPPEASDDASSDSATTPEQDSNTAAD
jgi:hypothetical protein